MARKTSRKTKSGRRKKASKTGGKGLDSSLRLVLASEANRLNVVPTDVLFSTENFNNLTQGQKVAKLTENKLSLKRAREEKRANDILLAESFQPSRSTSKNSVTKNILDKYQIIGSDLSKNNRTRVKRILQAPKPVIKPPTTPFYDLWTSNDVKTDPKAPQYNKICPQMPRTLKAKDALSLVHIAPVEVCHPGGSINPSVEQYEEGMKKAVQIEQPIVLKQKAERDMYALLNSGSSEFPEAIEDGDDVSVVEDDESQIESDFEIGSNKRKSKAKRNKIRRQRAKEGEEQKSKKLRKDLAVVNQVPGLKKLEKEFKKKEESKNLKKKEIREKIRQTEVEKRENAVVYMENGKQVIVPRSVDVNLPSDLPKDGKLRRITPHGNLFLDRFLSLRSRNLVDFGERSAAILRKTKPKKKTIAIGQNFTDDNHLVKKPTPKGTKKAAKAVYIRPRNW